MRGIRANALCPGWVITPMGDGAMDELGGTSLVADGGGLAVELTSTPFANG